MKKLELLLEIARENGTTFGTEPVESNEALENGSLKAGYDVLNEDGKVKYLRYSQSDINAAESDLIKIAALNAAKNIKTIKACAIFFVVITVIQLCLTLFISFL